MRDDNTIAIAFWSVSKTGKYLAYGLSQGGDEMAVMHIKNVDTGINLSGTNSSMQTFSNKLDSG